MFTDENVSLKLSTINHRRMEKDGAEYPLLELTLELNPFQAARAAQVSDFIRSFLFTRTDAEVNQQISSVVFAAPSMPQKLTVRMAPDQPKPSFVIEEGQVGLLHVKRSKQTSTWRLVFTVTFSPRSKNELAAVVDAYLKGIYVTFEDARPDLFSELGTEERKTRRAAAADATVN